MVSAIATKNSRVSLMLSLDLVAAAEPGCDTSGITYQHKSTVLQSHPNSFSPYLDFPIFEFEPGGCATSVLY